MPRKTEPQKILNKPHSHLEQMEKDIIRQNLDLSIRENRDFLKHQNLKSEKRNRREKNKPIIQLPVSLAVAKEYLKRL